jgi:hypothetical protein
MPGRAALVSFFPHDVIVRIQSEIGDAGPRSAAGATATSELPHAWRIRPGWWLARRRADVDGARARESSLHADETAPDSRDSKSRPTTRLPWRTCVTQRRLVHGAYCRHTLCKLLAHASLSSDQLLLINEARLTNRRTYCWCSS